MNTLFNVIEKNEGYKGKDSLDKLYNFLKQGSYLVTFQLLDPQADLKTYRGLYFVKVQAIAEETGHGKKEMHAILKEHLLPVLFKKNSTKDLSLEEWLGLVKAIDLWAFQTYGVIIG